MKLLIMITIFILTICAKITFGDETVKFATVVFRHGDRTPIDPYPKDPYKDQSLWPVKFGELTNLGKRQHYAFGKWLRQRYSHLLSTSFDPAEIYVRSTDVDRTLMSAQANLAGMYPPSGKSVWNSDLMWQPIPIHTVPEQQDEILSMKRLCPAYEKEFERVTHTREYIARQNRYKELMTYLSDNTGLDVKTYDNIEYIYSNLYIEQLYNFTLPAWTHAVYPDKMKEPACYAFKVFTFTPYLARLKAGPLLKKITEDLVSAVSDKKGDKYKVHIYSAHDSTVSSVLNALGIFDNNCPCYTSAVLFEIIQDDSVSTPYLRISYRNTTDIREPIIMDIPKCGTKCPLKKFQKIYDYLLSVDWEHECTKEFPTILVICFVIGLFICTMMYVSHKIFFKQVYQKYRNNLAYTNLVPLTESPLKVVEP